MAREAKAAIKRMNQPDAMMTLDYPAAIAGRDGSNILTG